MQRQVFKYWSTFKIGDAIYNYLFEIDLKSVAVSEQYSSWSLSPWFW